MTRLDVDGAGQLLGAIEDALSSAADCSGGYDHGADEALTALDRIRPVVSAYRDATVLARATCITCHTDLGREYPGCGMTTCAAYRFRTETGE